ncbi:hypothetical protein GT037_006328 [Alternaria burnsii]|uniref:Ubiquitin-like domain-containing protein n=1 Tax=Alternaria burnsii TaxID=1187904 RepID=A0A8H7B5S1_9PLEO|nr:uncharacterized protein GT037_006328 [Alternaria burnsii]KAF7675609.1 hypothetical protein GT037_006328 [Alternaria burnsii]
MKVHNNTLVALFDKQDSSIKGLQTRLDEVNRRVTTGNNLLSALVRSTRANWLLQLGHDLKALMLKIVAVNLATYAAVDKIQASVLDIQLVLPTLTRPISDPRIFYLEDAIGRVSTITLDFITSWDALLAVLEVRFQGKPGIKKVLKKEYVLQNRATGKDVNVTQKWDTVFRPGLWFDMDMIFQKSDDDNSESSLGTKCIRCHAKSEQPRGLGSTCLHCKHVLRIVDITDEASVTTFAPEAPDSLVTAPPVKPERRIVHPVPPSGSGKRKRDDDPDEEPANFNRVRLIKAKRRRLNKDLPEQASNREKRKQEDGLEIDVSSGPSKRHKYEDSQADLHEQNHSAKTYLQRQQQQGKMKAWEPSQPTSEFNKSSGKENPSSFTNYRDGNQSSKSRVPSARSSHATPPSYMPSYVPSGGMTPYYSSFPGSYEYCYQFVPAASRRDHRRRQTPRLPKPDVAHKRPVATEEDAIRVGIPSGYSYRNWDPTEEPIMLLGSVFDANSLGKWIYDWTVFYHGTATPLAEMAGELWLLLIQLAGKVKRAEETLLKIRRKENHEMVEDFLESGERLWIRFAKLLKICEDYMWKAAKEEAGNEKPVSMGKSSGREFVESMFGKDRELEKTEKLMTGMRLWSMRFDANCEDILRYPCS